MKWVTICFLSLAITVGFSTAQDETEEELTKFKEFKVRYYTIVWLIQVSNYFDRELILYSIVKYRKNIRKLTLER
jgi:hypothetical protein